MKINRKGCTRIVFVFKHFVIKIPNILDCHYSFLTGCVSNLGERNLYKNNKDFRHLLAPSLYCSIFGLIQIQMRCEELDRDLTIKEKHKFTTVSGGDLKKENFGYYKKQIVCLDYGKE